MARSFARASTQYLNAATTVVALSATALVYPLTIACWFRATTGGVQQNLVSIGNSGSGTNEIALSLGDNSNNNDVVAYSRQTTTSLAETSTQFTVGQWHHAAGVWESTSSRIAYLDGGNPGSNTDTKDPTGMDITRIGARARSSPGNPFDGDMAEVAIWDVALTAAEVAMLARGISPLRVRPQSLLFYAPLVRDEDEDYVGGVSLTAVNSPTIAAHPRTLRTPAPLLVSTAVAGAGYTLTAVTGEFASGGVTAVPVVGRWLAAATAVFAETGNDAGLLTERVLVSATTVSTLAAADTNLLVGYALAGEVGAVNVAGTEAGLLYTGSYTLTADAAAVTLTGSGEAGLQAARILTAGGSAVTLDGRDVGQRVDRVLLSVVSAVALNGTGTGFVVGRVLAVATAPFTASWGACVFVYSGDTFQIYMASVEVNATPAVQGIANATPALVTAVNGSPSALLFVNLLPALAAITNSTPAQEMDAA